MNDFLLSSRIVSLLLQTCTLRSKVSSGMQVLFLTWEFCPDSLGAISILLGSDHVIPMGHILDLILI